MTTGRAVDAIRPRRWIGRGWSVPIVLTVSLVALGACSDGQALPAAATATVSKATISTGVSASGSLAAINTQDLGFVKGGQLTEVSVKVGDHVTEGQTLAKIDDFALKQNVTQQEANLAAQEALLGKATKNPALAGGNSTLAQAKSVVAATAHQAATTRKADKSAIHRASKQLDVDEDAQDSAEHARHKVEKACDKSKDNTSTSDSLQALSDRYLELLQEGDTKGADSALAALNLALQTSVTNAASSPCAAEASADAAVTGAKQRVAASRTVLEAAKQREKTDIAAGKLAVENAEQGVVAAQNSISSTGSDRPYTLTQQRALVTNAETLVESAKKDLDDATLQAPFSGTVAAINGTVGEFLSPSTGTTALAPGTGAAIPGTDTAGAAAGAAAAATRPGGSQFLVLTDIHQLQAVLPFEESDAAQIKPKQKVSVAFDAVPDLTEDGTVTSVAPTSTSISGVITYYVTVRLDGTDERLKGGQTARATVLTQERTDVLSVPNDAVTKQGADSTVVVVEPDGTQHSVVFQPGVVGPDRTEVLSGLTEGQNVVSPTGH